MALPLTGSTVETVVAAPQWLHASVKEALHPTGQAGATPAWLEFCEQQPRECTVDLSEPETVSLDHNIWQMLARINVEANRLILPVGDHNHWGVVDRWDYPDDGLGDCEDIQLLKRKLLVEGGLPRRAMRMTVVIDEDGAGHAVLMVRTDHGDFILDNKRNEVLPWQETGYHFVKQEGTNSIEWVWLEGRTSPIVTAHK